MTENTLRVLGALSFEEQDALGRWLAQAVVNGPDDVCALSKIRPGAIMQAVQK